MLLNGGGAAGKVKGVGAMLFVGDDWAEDHHDVELVDEPGKVLARTRFPQGLADGWAFKKLYRSKPPRAALPAWLHEYNHHRPNTATGKATPMPLHQLARLVHLRQVSQCGLVV